MPVATDWSFAPDPVLEPMTEIVSAHGSSEAPDSPLPIHEPIAGNCVRDLLVRGYRLGFVGSGDSHDGHPGLPHLANSGSADSRRSASEPTREGVLAALRARRVYATNGFRIFLSVTLDGSPMGAALAAPAAGKPARLAVLAVGESGFERIDVIRGPNVVRSIPGEDRMASASPRSCATCAPAKRCTCARCRRTAAPPGRVRSSSSDRGAAPQPGRRRR